MFSNSLISSSINYASKNNIELNSFKFLKIILKILYVLLLTNTHFFSNIPLILKK
nr:MAG TPA: hypothetical protein [Caudoviricetes sp.]